jgi:PAS domain S-box-containing protein
MTVCPNENNDHMDLLVLASTYAEDAILVTTAQMDLPGPQILYVNSVFTQMTGYSAAELLGKTPRILQGPKTDRAMLQRLRKDLDEGKDFIGRTVNYRRDGTEFEIEWIITHLRDSEGRTTHYMALQRDITGKERARNRLLEFDMSLKKSSQELLMSMEKLRAAERLLIKQERLSALGQMTAGLVHDIGNALNPIVGCIDLLNSIDDLPQNARRYISIVAGQIRHTLDILDNLKKFYIKDDSNESRHPVNLRTLIEEIPDATRAKWEIESRSRGIRISLDLELTDVPEVMANPTELRRVLANLVLNAVDAMPEGGHLAISLREHGGEAVIEVRDTGTGMPPEIMHRCFEPYVTTKEKGAGIGLSICHGIVERHGGRLQVRSAPQEGTVFTIFLPVPK